MTLSGPCGSRRRGRFYSSTIYLSKNHLLVMPDLKKLDRKFTKTVYAIDYISFLLLRTS